MKEIWELVDCRGVPSGVLYDRGAGGAIDKENYFKVVEVFVKVGDRVLVTRRHKSKWCGLLWEAPGGGVIGKESDRAAAVRELFEETGITSSEDELIYLGRYLQHPAMVESFLLVLDRVPTIRLQESESIDYRFVKKDKLLEMRRILTGSTYERVLEYQDKIFN